MTREEAKVWASLPREKLAIISRNIDRHYDVIVAYANGADVQTVDIDTSEWIDTDNPLFALSRAYRVKPSAEQPAEPWKPKGIYFFLSYDGEVIETHWNGSRLDINSFEMGNCFRTRNEAEAARELVRAALKGQTISKTETVEPTEKLVESLDGEPLSLEEMAVVRDFREYKAKGDSKYFLPLSGYEADFIGSIRQMIKEGAK